MTAHASARSVENELEDERFRPVALDTGALRAPDWKQVGVRFLFGATIALAAGLVGMRFGPRVGGVFLAFPAVLPAALTYLQKKSGPEKTDVDAMGAVAGSVAMVVFALIVAAWARGHGPLAVAAAAIAWIAVALGLFRLARALLRRTRARRA